MARFVSNLVNAEEPARVKDPVVDVTYSRNYDDDEDDSDQSMSINENIIC